MAYPNRSNILQQFFKPVGEDVITNPTRKMAKNYAFGPGSLISFSYTPIKPRPEWQPKNDLYPLVIVVDNNSASDKISAINLHRLTFPSIRELIQRTYRMGFSYAAIKDDRNFRDAYRTYKKNRTRQIKVMDSKFLLGIMSLVRSYDPAEVQIIRRQAQEQIRQLVNPNAAQLTNLNQPQQGEIGG